jgi:hypothetical protein
MKNTWKSCVHCVKHTDLLVVYISEKHTYLLVVYISDKHTLEPRSRDGADYTPRFCNPGPKNQHRVKDGSQDQHHLKQKRQLVLPQK